MQVLDMARELGKTIQEDEQFKRFQAAKAETEKDEALQAQIGEFNLKRIELDGEMKKEEKNEDLLKAINFEMGVLYQKIMSNPHMAELNEAKKELDKTMQHINTILVYSINGETPDNIRPEDAPQAEGCSGSCSGCSGCN